MRCFGRGSASGASRLICSVQRLMVQCRGSEQQFVQQADFSIHSGNWLNQGRIKQTGCRRKCLIIRPPAL